MDGSRSRSPGRRPTLITMGLVTMGVGAALLLAACGQRSALYLPDRNARVVTRPAASAPASAPSSAPSAAPAAEPR